MTISDKIRIYELSRDLNLENKDILDAAQKLSISVKSHSSSISAEDAKKIKNHLTKKNSDKKILSINKPSIKKDNLVQKKGGESSAISSVNGKPFKGNSNQNPLLIKPLNKPEEVKTISNQQKNPKEPNILNSSQSRANLRNQNLNKNSSQNFSQDKKNLRNNTTPPIKSPTKPPIQLIAKPKNINNNFKSNESAKNIYNSGDKRQLSNKPNQNTNKPKPKNFSNKVNPPELVGAPIRREDSNITPNKPNNNKQNTSYKQTTFSNRTGQPNRSGSPNRPGMPNRPGAHNRPGSPNRRVNPNRPGDSNGPSGNYRQGKNFRQGDFNRPGSKFNDQKSTGIRKPVSPNELLQLQKTNKSEKDKLNSKNNEKQNVETPKHKVKAPNNRPNAAPSSKKPPHRTFSNSSKKPGRTDWDDSAKLEALRNKNPQKQRQKVHIIGENDDSLTSETSGYSGEKISILSASLARPKREKSDEATSKKSLKQFKKKKKETTRQRQKRRAMEVKAAKEAKLVRPFALSRWASITVPLADLSGLACRSSTSETNKIISSNLSIFCFLIALTGTITVSPPQSSAIKSFSDSSCFTLSGDAPSLSILFIATTIGTFAALA